MAELQTTLHDIAAAIVDSPDEVKVVREEDDDTITLTLTVAPDDMGIGKSRTQDTAVELSVLTLFSKLPYLYYLIFRVQENVPPL